jgi:hypothetical protein
MTRVLVTVGTENELDWVKTPDGQKFTLGPVSVAKFVGSLVRHGQRAALDQFLMSGETMVQVDLDQMWELLKPVRVRCADGSFMPLLGTEERFSPMNDLQVIEASLQQAEKALSALTQKVAKGSSPKEIASARSAFVVTANKIKSPNQSKNQTYYGYGTPPVYEVGDAVPEPFTVDDKTPPVPEAPTAKSASLKLAYDVLQENSTVAGEILARLEETDSKIDSLVKLGKKFNATKAKADVHAVVSKVAGILRDVDLTQPWVRGDLDKLATRATQLHSLFIPKS